MSPQPHCAPLLVLPLLCVAVQSAAAQLPTDRAIQAAEAELAALRRGGAHTGKAAVAGAHAAPPHARFPDMTAFPERSIALHNLWGEQYFGRIAVGTPPVQQTVVFDTGSGALVIKGRKCHIDGSSRGIRGATGGCQGPDKGYAAASSRTSRPSMMPFAGGYGSGGAGGVDVMDVVRLAGHTAPGMLFSVAEDEAARFSGFKFDGIFGLDFEVPNGADTDNFNALCQAAARRPAAPKMFCGFALFLTPKPNQKGSLLTIGGYLAGKARTGSRWRTAQVVAYYGKDDASWGYWAVRISSIGFGGTGDMCSAAKRANKGQCIAIYDSGTTYIQLPGTLDDSGTSLFHRKIRAVVAGKKCWKTGASNDPQYVAVAAAAAAAAAAAPAGTCTATDLPSRFSAQVRVQGHDGGSLPDTLRRAGGRRRPLRAGGP